MQRGGGRFGLQVHVNLYRDGGGSIRIKGSVWRFVASGLSGGLGEVQVRGDGTYAINLANGSGVCTGPEQVTVISLAMGTEGKL